MNYTRIAVSSLGGTVAYFVLGGVLFAALPWLSDEFKKHPEVFRVQDDMKRVMPAGMLGILAGIVVMSVLFSMVHPSGGGILDGARFGALIGAFVVGGFSLHNHMLLNVSTRFTVGQAVASFVQWLGAGIAVSLIYAR